VDRDPTLTIVNATGHQITLIAPASTNLANGARTQLQPTETNRNINVTYRIGQIQFTEQVTMSNADVTVTLTRRPPTITVVNQTGRDVHLTTPVFGGLGNGQTTAFLAPALNQAIPITYRIGRMQFTETANMANQDVTVTLTGTPPVLTIVNQTGGAIVALQMRVAGGDFWLEENLLGLMLRPDGTVDTTHATMSITDLFGVLEPGGSRRIPLEVVEGLTGNRFDIIAWGPLLTSNFSRHNVLIDRDITINFTRN